LNFRFPPLRTLLDSRHSDRDQFCLRKNRCDKNCTEAVHFHFEISLERNLDKERFQILVLRIGQQGMRGTEKHFFVLETFLVDTRDNLCCR
jgi:hypothetical protein